LTGYVPDVRPVVAGASVCIVPIRIGGGQRLKILEAMALGTPVVSTSKGMEGLDDFTPGEHALVADEPEAFAQAVLCLLRNREQRDTIARNARRLMETRYRWDRVLVPFLDLVDQVAGVP
jgi:glycosyltransferase involved in cell wall biosynthesis